jgi:hypothetical protein
MKIQNTRESKKALVKYIADQGGLPDLKQDSPLGKSRFTIGDSEIRDSDCILKKDSASSHA